MPILGLKINELVMAKLIEFYIPKNFTKPWKGLGRSDEGMY
jgi:hypothetical protein